MRKKGDILRASKRLRKKRFLRKFTFLFLFLLLFSFSILSFFYLPYFKIKKISIGGNSTISSEKLTAEVLNYLEEKDLKIFPRDNILILSKDRLKEDILNRFSRIKEININKSFFDTLSLEVKERNNEAIFCLDDKREQCDFLDENGITFEKAPYFSAGVFLSFFDQRQGSSTPTWESNSQVISQEQFKKLIEFKNLVQEKNIKVSDITLKKEGVYQLDTDEGWYILLNEQNESRLSFENLKSTLDSIIKTKRGQLDYIDLRFGNKVFYKFKN